MTYKNSINVLKIIGCLIVVTALMGLVGCNKTNGNADSDISSYYSKGNNTVVSENATSENNSDSSATDSVSENKEVSDISSNISEKATESIQKIDSDNKSNSNSVISKNETVTAPIDENQATTYFEKHNLKITPISNELCFNNDPNHQCPNDKDIGITVTSVPERFYYSFDVELFDDNFDISKYKAVKYYDYAVNSQKWEDCHMSDVVSFDKYSGKTIDNGTLHIPLVLIKERQDLI